MSTVIDRLEWTELGAQRFESEYANGSKPVVIKGAFDHWPARKKWSIDFFRSEYGDREVQVDQKTWRMADLLGRIETSSAASPAPYLRNEMLERWPPALQADIAPIPLCAQRNWLESPAMRYIRRWRSLELYIGGAGAKFPVLHYDQFHLHAFLMQLQGEKEYLVYAPDQLEYMYRGEAGLDNKSKVDDPDLPDLQRFPKFAQAKGVRFKLYPGETLFVPCGWWHTAKILSTSITVSINGITQANWADFVEDISTDAGRSSALRGLVVRSRLAFCGWSHGRV